VKRLSADDSAGSRVKVGHCQATIEKALVERRGLFAFLSKNNPLDCVSLHRIASHRIASHRIASQRSNTRCESICIDCKSFANTKEHGLAGRISTDSQAAE
jgi:hypothetical protein